MLHRRTVVTRVARSVAARTAPQSTHAASTNCAPAAAARTFSSASVQRVARRVHQRTAPFATPSASSSSTTALTLTPSSSRSPFLSFLRHKSCGIVGLPNVGKSTLFNALTDTQLAQASNYPFCTIEPNVANVAVPDPVLQKLAEIAKTNVIIYNQVKFVDIAGIIKGASEGAGLGNKFLNNIRDVDVILHVVRCFENSEIIHVDSKIDPIADMAVIETELLLADLQTIEKRLENLEKNKKKDVNPNPNVDKPTLYKKIRTALNAGIPIADVVFESEHDRAEVANLQLITSKPMAYVCNVDEQSTTKHNQYTKQVFEHVEKANSQPETTVDGVRVKRVPRACLRVCSQLESEVQSLGSPEARKEFLAMNDLNEGSLLSVIQTSNKLLQSICYYTVGEKEARAWGISVGTNAQAAAGKIHSDLSKGFVCAEVIKPADYIRLNGDAAVREAGLMKTEGKGYIVQDGDIIVFRVSGQKGR